MLLRLLKLLFYWMASCPAASVPLATSPVLLRVVAELATGTGTGSLLDPFYETQVQGLACLLLGSLLLPEKGDVDVKTLTALVATRIGIEAFQQKVDQLWRSEALQRPPRGLAEFRWYGSRFRDFVRQQQRAVQRRLVQLYVSDSLGENSSSLSDDIADHYKQLIRVQDTELREVRRENEQLRAEVEAFMRRSLGAGSFALVDKSAALQEENEALHEELEQLQKEVEDVRGHSERERSQLRAAISELEQQLKSMAVGYEQVERSNAELSASLAAVGTAARLADLGVDPARKVQELSAERQELLDLLGFLVAEIPEARRYVAPLGDAAAAVAAAAARVQAEKPPVTS